MNSQLPPERDLPPNRRARMRHRVLAGLAEQPRPARRRWRIAATVAGLAAVLGATVTVTWTGGAGDTDPPGPEVVALGDTVLSPRVRQTGRRCLAQAQETYPEAGWPQREHRPVLVNYFERPDQAVVLYRAGTAVLECTAGASVGPDPVLSTGAGMRVVELPQWLPGPVGPTGATTSDPDHGDATIVGFASRRVARVVLDDGAGDRTEARLVDGIFAVISAGDTGTGRWMLISYDADGHEIDRRQVLGAARMRSGCWVDKAGRYVLHDVDEVGRVVLLEEDHTLTVNPPPERCGRAEPWAPPHGWAPA
jgi:hypothetical protein